MARPQLDRKQIVAVALDLLDEVGLDGLTTRALAARLDVRSPALYWHFKNTEDLRAAMAEAMSLQLPRTTDDDRPTRPTRAWVANRMIERGRLFRGLLLSRRDGARVHAGSRPPASRLDDIESQVDLLCRVGLTPPDAGRITLAVSRFVVGWVLEEQSALTETWAPDLAGYPRLAAAADVDAAESADRNFELCLDGVVRGLLGVRTR